MESITMTNHAAIRKQQRGIPESVLDCLMQFGKTSHDNRCCISTSARGNAAWQRWAGKCIA